MARAVGHRRFPVSTPSTSRWPVSGPTPLWRVRSVNRNTLLPLRRSVHPDRSSRGGSAPRSRSAVLASPTPHPSPGGSSVLGGRRSSPAASTATRARSRPSEPDEVVEARFEDPDESCEAGGERHTQRLVDFTERRRPTVTAELTVYGPPPYSSGLTMVRVTMGRGVRSDARTGRAGHARERIHPDRPRRGGRRRRWTGVGKPSEARTDSRSRRIAVAGRRSRPLGTCVSRFSPVNPRTRPRLESVPGRYRRPKSVYDGYRSTPSARVVKRSRLQTSVSVSAVDPLWSLPARLRWAPAHRPNVSVVSPGLARWDCRAPPLPAPVNDASTRAARRR